MAFWRTWYHLVWATKNREALIGPPVEKRLLSFIVHKASDLGVHIQAINACPDHVHLLVSIPPRHSVADVVKRLKGSSARYMNTMGAEGSFGWQRGYGVLTLGEKQRATAEAYVLNQKEHHQDKTLNPWLEQEAGSDQGPEVHRAAAIPARE